MPQLDDQTNRDRVVAVFGARFSELRESHLLWLDGKRIPVKALAAQVSELSGEPTSHIFIRRLLDGEVEPRLSQARAIADIYGVPLEFFSPDPIGQRVAALILPFLAADSATTAAIIDRLPYLSDVQLDQIHAIIYDQPCAPDLHIPHCRCKEDDTAETISDDDTDPIDA